MAMVKKCQRCGIQSSTTVNVTATCKKCGTSFLICGNCQFSWKSQKCPSCSGWMSSGTWNFQVLDGQGKVTDEMTSYLGNFSPKTYLKLWADQAEARTVERAKDGDSAHQGIALETGEVTFLRAVEDIIKEPIYTVRDDRGSYVVIKDGHVEKIRLFNAELRENMPETISNLTKLKEFRYEKFDRNKGNLNILPESFAQLSEVESIILRNASYNLNAEILQKIPTLKKLSLRKTFNYSEKGIKPILLLTDLEELNLGSCVINNTVFDEPICNFSNLKKLNMSFAQELKILPESMKQLENLEELDLTSAKIGQRGYSDWPAWITDLPQLKIIYRDYYQANGWEPVEDALRERNPESYSAEKLDPSVRRRMSADEEKKWWKDQRTQIFIDGWTGIE